MSTPLDVDERGEIAKGVLGTELNLGIRGSGLCR